MMDELSLEQVNTLRVSWAKKLLDFKIAYVASLQKNGFSVSEISTIMSMPENVIKALISEKNKIGGI